MYLLKSLPQDFQVKELSNLTFKSQGPYLVFKLTKTNYNTLDAITLIAQKLNLPLKAIGFAGSKDKKAVTEQRVSIKGIKKEKVLSLNLENIQLELLGCQDQPITLGDLEGNSFEIVVRNLEEEEIQSFLTKTKKKIKITNYFDDQRFGTNNIEIGKSLVKKDFKKACEILKLEAKNNDFVGALKKLPLKLLKLYVHAYQSYLWNETVKELIKNKINAEEAPLIGFASEIKNKKLKEVIENLLKKENLNFNDFIIKPFPELSQEGNSRKIQVEVKDFKILEKEADELNKGKLKTKVSFSLPKGSYATRVIKELMGTEDI